MNFRVSMPNIAIAALAIGFAALTAPPASAQGLPIPGTTDVQKSISLKVGGYFLTGGTARQYGQHTQLSAGLDYALAKSQSTSPSLPSIYVDYQGGSKASGHVQTLGAGIAIRSYTSAPVGANEAKISPYVGTGAGIYHLDAKQPGQSGTKTSVGAKIFAGLEFSKALFIEANYQFLPSKNGINASGAGVQVGVRF